MEGWKAEQYSADPCFHTSILPYVHPSPDSLAVPMPTRTRVPLHLLAACLLALLLPVSLAQAQSEGDTTVTDRPPVFRKGGWGLQYEATSLEGALSGFQGSLISARYHRSARQALRVGVSVNATLENGEETRSAIDDDSLSGRDTKRQYERDDQDYGLSGQYVYYIRPADRLFVFAGIGPRFGYDKSRQEQTDPNRRSTTSEKNTTESTVYRIGLGGALGVEWFVHSHISLSVEYPLAIDYISREEEATRQLLENGSVRRERTTTTETDRYEIGGESVRIGVTFSFGP